MPEPTKTKAETVDDIELELKKLQLEEARLRIQDAQENIAKREMERGSKRANQLAQGAQLKDEEEQRRLRFISCPHRKGGTDYAGWKKGDSQKYTVIRMQMPNADYISQCTRCSVRVIPPVEPIRLSAADIAKIGLEAYGFKRPADAGYFLIDGDRAAYRAAMKEYLTGVDLYNEWLEMPTDNVASSACLPRQTRGTIDWVRFYRIALHEALGIPIFKAMKYEKPKRRRRKEEDEEDAA